MREYLKKLREERQMTQEDVAEALGLSRSYYVRIENKERQKNIDLSLAIKIGKLFCVSVEWIIEQENQS